VTTMSVRVSGDVRPSKALHVGLWVAQGLLGVMFLAVGAMKATQPIAALADMLGWPAAVPAALVRVIGVAEILGALGLILPAATRIKPMLTPLAGIGLATAMLLAMMFHISRGEVGALPLPLVLGGLAAFVAWGRAAKAPIARRWSLP
jgi:putative oxidoreductase